MKISRFCVISCLFLREKFLFASVFFSSSTRGASNKTDIGSQPVHFQFDCCLLFFFAVFCSFLCVIFSSQYTICKMHHSAIKIIVFSFVCLFLHVLHSLPSLQSCLFCTSLIILCFHIPFEIHFHYLLVVDSLSVNKVSRILTTIIIHKQIQLVNTVNYK